MDRAEQACTTIHLLTDDDIAQDDPDKYIPLGDQDHTIPFGGRWTPELAQRMWRTLSSVYIPIEVDGRIAMSLLL